MVEIILPIILGVLASGGLWTLIQYLIQRKDSKNDTIDKIKEKVDEIEKNMIKNERDALRTQLLVMFADYSEDKSQILELAHRYFAELDGDWYLTPIFCKWLEDNSIGKPEWFRG